MEIGLNTLLQQVSDRCPTQCVDDRIATAADLLEQLAANCHDIEPLIPTLSSQLRSPETNGKGARRRVGAFYTPHDLVAFCLTQSLDIWLDGSTNDPSPIVLDPACGTGRFLLAAGQRLVDRYTRDHHCSDTQAWRHIAPNLRGFDIDPIPTAWLRGRLTSLAGGDTHAASGIRTCDALNSDALTATKADVIVGNPPFGTPLRKLTDAESIRKRAAAIVGSPIGPYADMAAIFLLLSTRSLRPQGRLALVQPLSVLAARDTGPIRDCILDQHTLETAWASPETVFDAQVHTCVLAISNTPTTSKHVGRYGGLPAKKLSRVAQPTPGASWSPLVTAAMGIPNLPKFQSQGTLNDIAAATADFRDQFYGLRGAIVEVDEHCHDNQAPILTTALLDPARCRWGTRPCRLHGHTWTQPAIDLNLLGTRMKQWARSRLVPKVLLPTQTRVLEPVLDERGQWLPSVPIITITTKSTEPSNIGALLTCPLISLLAMHRYLGTARTPHAIKLAARNVLQFPCPVDIEAWHAAGHAFQKAQHHDGDPALLDTCARHMLDAFKIAPQEAATLLTWWKDRLPSR